MNFLQQSTELKACNTACYIYTHLNSFKISKLHKNIINHAA